MSQAGRIRFFKLYHLPLYILVVNLLSCATEKIKLLIHDNEIYGLAIFLSALFLAASLLLLCSSK
jgi:hypothetical protein